MLILYMIFSARGSDMKVKEGGAEDGCRHSLLIYDSYKKSMKPVWSLYLKFVLMSEVSSMKGVECAICRTYVVLTYFDRQSMPISRFIISCTKIRVTDPHMHPHLRSPTSRQARACSPCAHAG